MEPEFIRLLETILHDPENIINLVQAEPNLLEATNATGENALRWCALERRYEDVKLLRSMGSSIQHSALREAVDMGHVDMLSLLLELGGEIEPSSATSSLKFGVKYGGFSRQKCRDIQSTLSAHGVHIDLTELNREYF